MKNPTFLTLCFILVMHTCGKEPLDQEKLSHETFTGQSRIVSGIAVVGAGSAGFFAPHFLIDLQEEYQYFTMFGFYFFALA